MNGEIKRGQFVIPDFQREFDWEPWNVRDLIKSIFMDYYIGTIYINVELNAEIIL
ncbi:DUF262 domain-containing protein [Galbibacter sp.]|uniref:DUF262 domain-containing protein n=1 Tax=Galbibacter sp. TaxID=2918471 RepID=UPI003A8FC508